MAFAPEVDFDETVGGIYQSTAIVHFGDGDSQIHRVKAVTLLLRHTSGVVWTSKKISYTFDGHVWGVVTSPGAIFPRAMSVHR